MTKYEIRKLNIKFEDGNVDTLGEIFYKDSMDEFIDWIEMYKDSETYYQDIPKSKMIEYVREYFISNLSYGTDNHPKVEIY